MQATGDDTLRDRLLADRLETAARLTSLRRQFDDIVAAATDVSTDDEHDPEGATIAYERAQVSALADQARGRLRELDLALARLEAHAYGTCERCGAQIGAGRLEARPSARTCITCARLG